MGVGSSGYDSENAFILERGCAFRGEGGLSGTEAFVTSSKLLTVFHSQVPRV